MVTVITGLTNAGKSTLREYLMDCGYKSVNEYTTRPMRKGEINHKDYHFTDDESFDRMAAAGEFAETLYVETTFGLWKYGARKEDLMDNGLLICGPHQMKQMLDSGIPMCSVLLDIDYQTAKERAHFRGNAADSEKELRRRFLADEEAAKALRGRVSLTLDAKQPLEENARDIIDWHRFNNISTAQRMSVAAKKLYFDSDDGLKPYLRMRDNGMPSGKVNQIAWLLLCGGGCAFCKTCREEPCGIKDGEKCTANIADYIRKCVYEEKENDS